MLRESAVLVLLVAMADVGSGCTGGCPPLTPSCNGDWARVEHYVTSDDCGLTEGYEIDCGEEGKTCKDGMCVSRPKERCPNGGDGVCRGSQAFRCEGEFLSPFIETCPALGRDAQCTMVPGENGHQQAVCALSNEPCESVSGDGAECQGSTRVSCVHGYPVEKEACDGANEHCLLVDATDPDGAVCALDLPCPPSGTACDGDRVYGCDEDGVPSYRRDCAELGHHCVVQSSRGLCSVGDAARQLAFRNIEGGVFQMAETGATAELSDFEMSETEVTVAQYAACQAAGSCSAPAASCQTDFQQSMFWLDGDLPVTCVTFPQAQSFCAFVGGRVPTDVEWEYVLRNGGDDVHYPWGDAEPTCAHTIQSDATGGGCGRGEPWPGCSRDPDVTTQGVCDLVGNVNEWVTIMESGSATPGQRGGSYDYVGPDPLDSWFDDGDSPELSRGIRCVRAAPSP